jgi:hypothetical protein
MFLKPNALPKTTRGQKKKNQVGEADAAMADHSGGPDPAVVWFGLLVHYPSKSLSWPVGPGGPGLPAAVETLDRSVFE